MFGKLLFFFVFPTLGISYKGTQNAEGALPIRKHPFGVLFSFLCKHKSPAYAIEILMFAIFH